MGMVIKALIDGFNIFPIKYGYLYFCPNCENVFGDGDVSMRGTNYNYTVNKFDMKNCPLCGHGEFAITWIKMYELSLKMSKKLNAQI